VHYRLYKDMNGQWRWRYVAANGRIIADSGEGYVSRTDCLHGIALIKGSANSQVIE